MQENFFQYAPSIIDIYEESRQAIVEEITKKPYQKSFNSITTMLEECYFIGATKFGQNFIA